ncbi:Hypothetical protein CINCED_3A012312 [Cinara cedri]|uniref:Uncharacterized protein n=1 Tax=Cinara cedri TaxID=506608 RepID=A0A5E4MRB6_9HEMI|nr:Hypothetical protein CINCED_3A012312 [Cinara cedri]
MIGLILSAVRQRFSSLYTNFRISNGRPVVYEKPKKVKGSEYALLLMTALYTASLTLSTTYESRIWPRTCEPVIPFGECAVGEIEYKFEIIIEYSPIQVWISFAVVVVAGTWSDIYGRQRKLLILIPIIGQIFSNSFRLVNYYWNFPYILHAIFTKIIPAMYVGRNLFWIGAMAYTSENSTVKLRTVKIAKLIGTYAISSLIGLGLVKILDLEFRCLYIYNHLLFTVPIFLNMMAVLIGIIFLNDTSVPHNNTNMLWIKPMNMIDDYEILFDVTPRNRVMIFKTLLSCQIMVVVRVGGRLNSFQSAGAIMFTLLIGEFSGVCNENETIHLFLMVLLYVLFTVPMLLEFM